MKGVKKSGLVTMALLALALSGCAFQAAGEPFPTSAQMLVACSAEKAAGTPQEKAPDCLRWWAISQGCTVQAVANAVNPIAIPIVTAGAPIAAPIISLGASFNTAICKQRGFLK